MCHKQSFKEKYTKELDHFISNALCEDIGTGDHTSLSCLSNKQVSTAQLLVKEPGIIAGVELAKHIFKSKNSNFNFETKIIDGSFVSPGDIVFNIEGPQIDLLATERLVLNCMQRMSGISSLTRRLSEKIKHTRCTLLDTRKTTPNFRYPEKWAVQLGGGQNHRLGLFDIIMIKDNHIDFCGSVSIALAKTKEYLEQHNLKIPVIIEARDEQEVKECLNFPWVHRILLDNMSPQNLVQSLRIINGKIKTEASGDINEKNIVSMAETGIDYISLGAITHSAKNIDLSLKAV